ncbi:MAG: hypothetical protein ETSY1_42390 [Candidatus Entotheonella factor]|uniref:Knr4/Smi1-like domain-containing protein n=1 Tax=Entotheonella factor TaxID=1429438 RepID=W4L5X6_ENTF1|nr:MAG: hypothetical protein ETSY1_42390 [Candidatus Entotheonella factor]
MASSGHGFETPSRLGCAMLQSLNDIADLVLDLWREAELPLTQAEQRRLRSCITSSQHFTAKFSNRLRELINHREPNPETPAWLEMIDDFFQAPPDRPMPTPGQRNIEYMHEWVAIVELILPFVYFDAIVRTRSFDDDVMGRIELAYLVALEIPRNVTEAQRLYDAILSCPQERIQATVYGWETIPQPFMAQMLFALLLSRHAEPDSALWRFQLQCLQTCPDYLLDIPELVVHAPGSYRPAFWLAYQVTDPLFIDILLERGSAEVQKRVEENQEYRRKRRRDYQLLESNTPDQAESWFDGLPESQRSFAALLMEFEAFLQEHAPDICEGLRPGIQNDQLQKLNDALSPLRLTDDLATLYKWHNGIEYGGFLFGFPELFPIEEVLRDYHETIEMCKNAGGEWSVALLPVAYESQVYRLASLTTESQASTPMLYHDIVEGTVMVQHTTLFQMIQTYLQAYREGAVYYDEAEEDWEIDEDHFNRIRLLYSPNASMDSGSTQGVYDLYEPESWPPEWQAHRL